MGNIQHKEVVILIFTNVRAIPIIYQCCYVFATKIMHQIRWRGCSLEQENKWRWKSTPQIDRVTKKSRLFRVTKENWTLPKTKTKHKEVFHSNRRRTNFDCVASEITKRNLFTNTFEKIVVNGIEQRNTWKYWRNDAK